jgi:hypothetical protein
MSLFSYSMSVQHQNCVALIIWTNLTVCTPNFFWYYEAVIVLEYKSWGSRQNETINIRETTRCLKFTTLSSLWIYRNVPFLWWRGVIVVGNRSVFCIFFVRPRQVLHLSHYTAVPCSFVGRFQHLARASCLHRLLYKKWNLKIEGAYSSRVFVPIDQTSRWIIPQDRWVWFVAVW